MLLKYAWNYLIPIGGVMMVGNKRMIYILLILIITIDCKAYINQNINTVSGLVYINDLYLLTQEQFNMIRDCQEIKYVLNMMNLSPELYKGEHALEKERIRALAKAGKRVIIKVWFGPNGPYNWSYCGYPNIAMQKEVQDYLFSAIDNGINQIGPENIYGMHLLEEDGHFCVDIDQPGDWRKNKGDVRSGKEDGDPYTNYSNLRALYGGPSDWTPTVPNIAQYNSIFRAETGLDMNNLPNDPLAYPVLDRWMARRLWAGAHRAFFKHLREKYPNIRRFVWANIATPWNGTDIGDLKDVVDGVINNPYLDTLGNHHNLSGIKALMPNAEHLVLLMGNPDISVKYTGATTAYLNGASGIGFFERSYMNQYLWNDNVKIWRKLSTLPVIKNAKPKVLIVTGNTDNGFSTSKWMLPFFKFPDVITDRDATNVELNQYKIVVLHYCTPFRNDLALSKYRMKGYGPDDRKLKRWVAYGGILIITSPPLFTMETPFFVAEERIALMTKRTTSESNPVEFSCKPGIAEKYQIKAKYNLLAASTEISWGKNVSYDQLPIGGVFNYGRGKIAILPIYHKDTILLNQNTKNEFRDFWISEVANYIADVVRGVIKSHDKAGTIIQEVSAPGQPFRLEWRDKNTDISIVIGIERFNKGISSEITRAGNYIIGP